MRDRPLTIAQLIESDGPGGAERMMLALSEALRERGHTVIPVGPSVGSGWLEAELRARGFAPETFTLKRAVDPRCVTGLAALFRRHRVDVAHSHEFTMGVYAAAAGLLAGVRHVITMHGGMHFADRWRRRAALRWAMRRSSACVTVSEAARARLVAALGVKTDAVRVLYNGVRPTPGRPDGVRRELGGSAEDLILLAVGNLYPVKGHSLLFEALRALPPQAAKRPWRLVIAGRGELEAALTAQAAAAGFADRVHLLGYRADVPDLLSAAAIYVMPSLSEGLPVALLEAMFAGRAIVAGGVGGIPEVVRDGRDALLVAPGDVAALAGALGRLLTDTALRERLGRAAAAQAAAEFTLDRMVAAYEVLYRSASASRSKTVAREPQTRAS